MATVLGLASRRLPGFAMSEHHDSGVAKAALCMAAAVLGGDVAGVVFHTDKGGDYVGNLFARACTSLQVIQSRGWVGSALDNAAAESFNSTVEHELLSRRQFVTKDQARREVARFIDAFNHRRRHSSCEMLPPVAFEAVPAERAAEKARQDQAAKPALSIAESASASSDGIRVPATARLHQLTATLPRFRGKPKTTN